jgi:homoserine dehydrogenase
MPDGSEGRRVVIFGLGTVGQALLELMVERASPLRLAGVADSNGAMAGDLDPAVVLHAKRKGPLPEAVQRADLLAAGSPDVVVDVTSCDFKSAEPSLSVILAGFSEGAHVVTANKAPLARFWTKLHLAAATADRHLGYASAAGASLPAVAVARSLARMDEVDSFEGVLTGTTTFIMDQIANGASFEDAVRRAQQQGITEPDPSVDVDGWDTAAKIVILANTLWGTELDLDAVHVRGLQAHMQAPSPVERVRLIGRAVRDNEDIELHVAPSPIDRGHPLALLHGSDKGVVFRGGTIGRVIVAGGRSSPRGAAAAVLADILEITEAK